MTNDSGQRTAGLAIEGTPLDTRLSEDGIREVAKAEAATRGTKSFVHLVQSRAARDPEFARALLREGVETAGKQQSDD